MNHADISSFNTTALDQQTQACLNLWAEVFRTGVQDAAFAAKKGNLNYLWLMDDACFPGSFVWLCELFDVAPDTARNKIRTRFRVFLKEIKGDPAFEEDV